MEQMLICLSIALIAGLLMSRLAKAVNLPAVTSYLVAGLLLGPFVLGRLGLSGLGIGFGSLEQVEGYGVVTQVALGFIAFVIGNEFRLSSLRSMGQQAITVGIAQAVMEDPDLLILDEPMNGLDKQGIAWARAFFAQLRDQGKTLIMASHSAEDVATLCDTVHEMEGGVLSGTAEPE